MAVIIEDQGSGPSIVGFRQRPGVPRRSGIRHMRRTWTRSKDSNKPTVLLILAALSLVGLGYAFSAFGIGVALAAALIVGSLLATIEHQQIGVRGAMSLSVLHLAAFGALAL